MGLLHGREAWVRQADAKGTRRRRSRGDDDGGARCGASSYDARRKVQARGDDETERGEGFMREVQDVREGREDGVKEIDFQAPLQIVKYPDPRLRAKNMRIDEFGDSLRDFAKEMLVAMVEYDGIGLAAPQIVKSSNRHSVFEEGCISFPDIYAEVLRPERVTVEYQDLDGKKCKMQLNGLKARVFQHEYDHLQGVQIRKVAKVTA
eukprot:jgi/Pico_ML_1/51787/g2634.t1